MAGGYDSRGEPPGGSSADDDDRFDGLYHLYSLARTPNVNDRPYSTTFKVWLSYRPRVW